MKRSVLSVGFGVLSASAAMAHPGAHVHPHDGAHWLVLVGGLAVLAVLGRLALAKASPRK